MSIRPIIERSMVVIYNRLGEVISYEPQSADAVEVLAIVEYLPGDSGAFSVGSQTPSLYFNVRAADIEVPEEGDIISFEGGEYVVRGVEKNTDRLTWRLFVQESA